MRQLLYAMTIAIAILASGCARAPEEGQEQRVDVFSSLQDVGRLEFAQMSVGKVGTIADPSFRKSEGLVAKSEALLDKMKVGQRIAVYSYDTYLRASIDLTALTPDDLSVDEEAHTVTLRLPPVTVDYDGRDITLREEHYRVNGLRSDITPAERARLKEQMNTEVKREIEADHALRDRLRATAERRAVSFFTALLADLGYQATVTVSK